LRVTSDSRTPAAVCDGGDLDCGSGLLLIIREAMAPLPQGALLEVRSRESSVAADLPAWCRLVGHDLEGSEPRDGGATAYLVRKKLADDATLTADRERARAHEWHVRARSTGATSARVYARNHSFDVGQPASFDTSDAAPSAVEHLLGALAGCLAVGLRFRITERGHDVFELEVSLRARLDDALVLLGLSTEGHAGLAGVSGRVFVESDADDAVLDEAWRETLRRSPVFASLARPVPLTIERKTI
jgi:TusA-related sulfurtransferase/uncharacterized OsmC-like protein